MKFRFLRNYYDYHRVCSDGTLSLQFNENKTNGLLVINTGVLHLPHQQSRNDPFDWIFGAMVGGVYVVLSWVLHVAPEVAKFDWI